MNGSDNGHEPAPLGQTDPAFVRAALERVLASQAFTNAGRLSRFLRFTVERTLEGGGDELKEYLLGVEVFDRTDAFDPRLDSIVRVEARRLRARLSDYYLDEGVNDPLVIRLPKGAYVPRFEPRALSAVSPDGPEGAEGSASPDATEPPAGARGQDVATMSARLVVAAIALLVLVAIGLGWTWRSSHPAQAEVVTIAVLPIVNYSGDPRQDTLAARLTDGIISELARVPTLAVRSRTSVLQYKNARKPLREVARALDVTVVLEAGVLAENGDIRVDARLVSASADRKFWVETFVGRQNDVRALERRIGQAAAAAIAAGPPPPR